MAASNYLYQKLGGYIPPFYFLLILFVFLYLTTACPTIYWRDGPEFVVTSFILGIGHPAGSPTYTLFSKIFTLFPMGSIPVRVHLVSVLFGALAVAMVFNVIHSILKLSGYRNSTFPAIGGACFLGLSPTFWLYTAQAKTYAMMVFFLAVPIYFYFLWNRRRDDRWLFLGSFLYGLGIGVHITSLFWAPGFLLYIFWPDRGKRSGRVIYISCFFFILGLSTYLYLPFRSVTNPTFDWGNPETLSGFFTHVTDKKDEGLHFYLKIRELPYRIWDLTKIFSAELTLWGSVLSLVGIWALFRRNKRLFLLAIFPAVANIIFFIRFYNLGGASPFIPSLLVLAIFSGLGMGFLLKVSARWKVKRISVRRLVYAITVVFVFFSFFQHFRFAEKRRLYVAYDTAVDIFSSLQRNGVVITELMWFPFRYLQDIEGFRNDMSILLKGDIGAPHIFNPLTHERFPRLVLPVHSGRGGRGYLKQLVNDNMHEHTFYFEPQGEFGTIFPGRLIPESLLVRLSLPGREVLTPHRFKEYMVWLKGYLSERFKEIDFFQDEQSSFIYYPAFLYGMGDVLINMKMYKEATSLIGIALALDPGWRDAWSRMALCYYRLGDLNKAKGIIITLLQNDKFADYIKEDHYHLALIYKGERKTKESEAEIRQAISFDSNFPRFHLELAKILTQQGNYIEAREELLAVIQKKPDDELFQETLKELRALRKKISRGTKT